MRSRTADWFETKIRYEKTQDDGTQKKVTEQYVVDALSFTEAESAITEEMKAYISGDYKITDIKTAAYHEIFFSDLDKDDKWYKAKLQFITIDEKTEKEKRTSMTTPSPAWLRRRSWMCLNTMPALTVISSKTTSLRRLDDGY